MPNKEAPVKNMDETGFRVGGRTQWMHVLSTPRCTYYQGIAVHDHWRPYYQMPDVAHALCNQHHLRELKALVEHDKEAWAGQMSKLLKLMLRCRHRYGDAPIPQHQIKRLEQIYHSNVTYAWSNANRKYQVDLEPR